jgi:hypothetical protein
MMKWKQPKRLKQPGPWPADKVEKAANAWARIRLAHLDLIWPKTTWAIESHWMANREFRLNKNQPSRLCSQNPKPFAPSPAAWEQRVSALSSSHPVVMPLAGSLSHAGEGSAKRSHSQTSMSETGEVWWLEHFLEPKRIGSDGRWQRREHNHALRWVWVDQASACSSGGDPKSLTRRPRWQIWRGSEVSKTRRP